MQAASTNTASVIVPTPQTAPPSQRRRWPRGRMILGIIGAVLLLRTPQRVFEGLAPVLVFLATILLVVQEPLAKRISRGSLVGHRTA